MGGGVSCEELSELSESSELSEPSEPTTMQLQLEYSNRKDYSLLSPHSSLKLRVS